MQLHTQNKRASQSYATEMKPRILQWALTSAVRLRPYRGIENVAGVNIQAPWSTTKKRKTLRSVTVRIYTSPKPNSQKDDRFRLVFIEFVRLKTIARRIPTTFQTNLKNISSEEVARGFRHLYKVIELTEEYSGTRHMPKIDAIITRNLSCFRSRRFKETISTLGVNHSFENYNV